MMIKLELRKTTFSLPTVPSFPENTQIKESVFFKKKGYTAVSRDAGTGSSINGSQMRATQNNNNNSLPIWWPHLVILFFERELKKRTHSYNKRGTEGESALVCFFLF